MPKFLRFIQLKQHSINFGGEMCQLVVVKDVTQILYN